MRARRHNPARMTAPATLHSPLDLIGNTPLVLLKGPSEEAGCEIWGKCEFANPGASVKDRAALWIVRDAEARGALQPGGTIVEGTAGNTGIGIALVANALGYKSIIVMPENQSKEKMDTLRALGAELVLVPPTKFSNPGHFVHTSRRLADETPGAVWANQFDNIANRQAHYETTGPEIWEQTEGEIDVLVLGIGTGGTVTGIARYLKERKPGILVVGADPEGSLFSAPEEPARPYLVEGIGEDFWPQTFDPSMVDRYVRVSDADSFRVARAITREEGILVGGSSGTALHAGLEVAREMDEGTTIVVIFPDTGRNYLSKLYSDSWMLQHGFVERPEPITVGEVLKARGGEVPALVTVGAQDKVRQAVDVLQEYGISQAPVAHQDSEEVASLVGSIRERSLLDRIFRDPDALQASVAEVMDPPLPMVQAADPVEAAFERLQTRPAVIVEDGGRALGVLTRSDLLGYLTHRRNAT